MKISVSKDFGTAKKPVLPLVPETTNVRLIPPVHGVFRCEQQRVQLTYPHTKCRTAPMLILSQMAPNRPMK